MTNDLLDSIGKSGLREFINFMTGKRLGIGMSRAVYEHAFDPTKVIKIETVAGHFQNVIEWETWNTLSHTKFAKWLAPCHAISACGIFLIMERTAPLRNPEKPKLLPAWIQDHKAENFGLIGERIVCHDYGTNKLLNHGAFGSKLRKTDFT